MRETPTPPVRIGIIGAENSHALIFATAFNQELRFPGYEVVGVWGETAEFAKETADKGAIPWIVEDPSEFHGAIDALYVNHRHGKYHLEAAWPFVEAGVPTFIDKPFCYRVDEARSFLEMTHKCGTPVTSFSGLICGPEITDLKRQIASVEPPYRILSIGHCDVESPWGGVFFYGVHQIQRLMELCGEDVERVLVSRVGQEASAQVVFGSGIQATLFFLTSFPPMDLAVMTEQGLRKLEPSVTDDEPLDWIRRIVELFETGTELRSHESLVRETAVLEALERAVTSTRWEEVSSSG